MLYDGWILPSFTATEYLVFICVAWPGSVCNATAVNTIGSVMNDVKQTRPVAQEGGHSDGAHVKKFSGGRPSVDPQWKKDILEKNADKRYKTEVC